MVDSVTSAASDALGTSKAAQSQQKLGQDMDYFMNLLVTQLKNQDPLDPMDPNEFTNQLVQFSAVEQQIQGNANLEKLIALQKANNVSAVVGYIDKTVEVSGNSLVLENGHSAGSYTLEGDSAKTLINIKDSKGNTVFSTTAETTAGRHNFTWDGINNQGYTSPDGTYKLTVSALDSTGLPLPVTQTTAGRVNGVTMQGGDVYLYIGNSTVSANNIIAIGSNGTPAAN